jgi:ketosteroid isomerase-like protein
VGVSLDPAVFKSLVNKIQGDQEKLQKFFRDSKFDELAAVVGEEVVFVSPRGTLIKTQKEIRDYFADLKRMGVEEVQFEPANAHVTELNGVEHNYVAYIIWHFSYSPPGKSDPVGSWAGATLHRFNCTWESPED